MFGEGKIDYIGYSWAVDYFVGTNCAICSVIKFGEGVEDFNFNGQLIESNEKYSVVTGMKGEGEYIQASINKSADINSLDCKNFITKA